MTSEEADFEILIWESGEVEFAYGVPGDAHANYLVLANESDVRQLFDRFLEVTRTWRPDPGTERPDARPTHVTNRDERTTTLRRIRAWLIFFIVALVLSGVTAFPLETELLWGSDLLRATPIPNVMPDFMAWIDRIRDALIATNDDYPFLAYGTDWLAFAHLVIAIAFIGPLRDPVRNIWIIQWGMICCVTVIPLALIAGSVRGIPFGWMLIDMSFGVFGIIPLSIVHRLIRKLERLEPPTA